MYPPRVQKQNKIMYSRIFGEIINADLHSARSNAIEIADEKLISLIERLMHCDVKEYDELSEVIVSHIFDKCIFSQY